MADLSVEVAVSRGLRLRSPVITASGTFGYGIEYQAIFDIQRLGAIICKTTTVKPRTGNVQPRIAEVAGGMLNSIGLQNVGLETVLREKAPVWATWQVPVIVNIAGENAEEFAYLASRLDGVPGVAGLELNISCPNVAGGLDFGQDPRLAEAVVRGVRRAASLPIIAKLTPNVTDIVTIARAVEAAGADAVSLINTVVGMAVDVRARRPVLGALFGGLSGPAIKPIALAMVYKVAGAVDIPIIGIGGISTAEDALEFIMAGATAVEVGTATFLDPTTPLQVLEGLETWCQAEGVSSLAQVRGAARR
ncbi:MAG: dihydroorotate dehydrogenase [Chloroflexi bacterium]|nr:dihydroorotate dehydrogenase [Chloroflexota bacterium]